MSVWFVSRHLGAMEWIQQQNIHIDNWVAHLDVNDVAPNDTVIGVMTLAMAAALCKKNVKCLALTYNTPEHLRGIELNADMLNHLDCKMIEYVVKTV